MPSGIGAFQPYTGVRVSISNLAARTWSRWAAALSTLVLVVTAVVAGARYVVCARTGATHRHACCAQRSAKNAKSPPVKGAEFVSARSCCEPHQVRPSGVAAVEQPAPALEVVSAALQQEAWAIRPGLTAARVHRGDQWPIRAGPNGHAERLARLQVFLI